MLNRLPCFAKLCIITIEEPILITIPAIQINFFIKKNRKPNSRLFSSNRTKEVLTLDKKSKIISNLNGIGYFRITNQRHVKENSFLKGVVASFNYADYILYNNVYHNINWVENAKLQTK